MPALHYAKRGVPLIPLICNVECLPHLIQSKNLPVPRRTRFETDLGKYVNSARFQLNNQSKVTF